MSKTIGQLWKKNSKGLVANGVLEVVAGLPLKISIFKNEKKKEDNQPDYNIIISEPMDKEEQEKRNEEGGL